MADHIPFITGETGVDLVGQIYGDSEFVRVVLDNAAKLCNSLPAGPKLWIDPAVDGLDDVSTRTKKPWHDFMSSLKHFSKLATPEYWAKPAKVEVESFASDVLDRCAKFSPAWITVPQLPFVSDGSRNKLNRALAEATGKWKASSGFKGKLILPLVITNQKQIVLKADRNNKVSQSKACFTDSGADGTWTVDKDLTDDSGSSLLHNRRFPALVALHKELNEATSAAIRIAGPYWGMNLVLWARGLVDYPAIGIGSGYKYFMAGGHAMHPTTRLAIPFLRRRVNVEPAFRAWLDQALPLLDPAGQPYADLSAIRSNYAALRQIENARRQIALFYKAWYNTIAAVAVNRHKALFFDFAQAYSDGGHLPDLPDAGTARKPGAVAHELMLSCQ